MSEAEKIRILKEALAAIAENDSIFFSVGAAQRIAKQALVDIAKPEEPRDYVEVQHEGEYDRDHGSTRSWVE